MSSLGSANAWRTWKSGWPGWKPTLRPELDDLGALLRRVEPEAFAAALDRTARADLAAFLDGVERYRSHPWRRDLTDPEPVWRDGGTALRAYGSGAGRPVLLVPSLINRATVLDLTGPTSFVRWLAARGADPYLVDWGAPGPVERGFTLTDYVAGRLERAFDAVRRLRPDAAPVVVGYCMGGLLALGLVQRRRADVAGLVLLATPWDFHADDAAAALRVASAAASLAPLIAMLGELPVDPIQALFAGRDPQLVVRKFVRYARHPPEPAAEETFLALEDWLNDGVPLAAPVALEALGGWYGLNTPALGQWRIAGAPVDPGQLDVPALVVVPANDRIVPPKGAAALARALPRARVRTPPLGHIGLIVGRGAVRSVWEPVRRFVDTVG